MTTNTKLIEEALQFVKDQPSSREELYTWASDAEIIISDLCKALSAAQPPAGYVVVPVETLTHWKQQVNDVAALTLKAERYQVGVSLKQEIADVLATAPKTQPAHKEQSND